MGILADIAKDPGPRRAGRHPRSAAGAVRRPDRPYRGRQHRPRRSRRGGAEVLRLFWKGMSMSKRNAAIGIVLGLALIAAVVAVIAPGRDGFRATTAASAQQNDKRWLAVAPGRVEPPSGIIKVAAPTIGIVSKVLVKVNDTVFAGEPLILLNDDEIQARYAAAEAQAGMRQRLRDEQSVTGKALRAPPAPRTRWPRPRPRCSTRRPPSTRPRSQWRASGGAGCRPDRRARGAGRAPRTSWRSARRSSAASRRRCRPRTRRRPPRRAAIWRSPASIWRS